MIEVGPTPKTVFVFAELSNRMIMIYIGLPVITGNNCRMATNFNN